MQLTRPFKLICGLLLVLAGISLFLAERQAFFQSVGGPAGTAVDIAASVALIVAGVSLMFASWRRNSH